MSHTKAPHRPRDPLEVGLHRHKKKESIIPHWLEERAGLFFSVTVATCLALSSAYWAMLPEVAEPIPTATLISTSTPAKVWRAGSSTHLESITVSIRNTSNVEALGVAVFATIRSQSVPLEGPASIAPGQTQTYTGARDLNVTSSDVVGSSFRCANCEASSADAGAQFSN